MNHEKSKALYAELKEFDRAIKNVAQKLNFTPEHIRMVMCVYQNHKSKQVVIEAAANEIILRRKEQAKRLKKIFSEMV